MTKRKQGLCPNPKIGDARICVRADIHMYVCIIYAAFYRVPLRDTLK